MKKDVSICNLPTDIIKILSLYNQWDLDYKCY